MVQWLCHWPHKCKVRVEVRPDPTWNRPPSFHRGLGSKCDKSTVRIIIQPLHTLMHVGKYVSYLPKVGDVRVEVRPDPTWNRPPFFHRGLGSKCDKSTVRIIIQPLHTLMHVGKYVSYLPKVGDFFRVLRFPPPIKLIVIIWPKVLKVARNTHKSNPIPPLVRSVTYNWIKCKRKYEFHNFYK